MFRLSPEQDSMQRAVRAFAAREISPHVDEWEAAEIFPRELFTKMAALGLAGMRCPKEYGGSDLDQVTIAAVAEELGGAYRATSFVFIHNMVLSHIVRHGTEEQKRRWALPMASGQSLGALALTEPASGSDAAALTTSAIRDGDSYVLNGVKRFISNADSADVLSIAVRTPTGRGRQGVSVILVERGAAGLSVPRVERKMALHASHVCEVRLENCRVPAENLVGEEGQGFSILMKEMDRARVNVAALAVGGAQVALDIAAAYAKRRVQFGRPIADFQAIQFMLADMATRVEAARLLVYSAATSLDEGRKATKECAMAKRYATDAAFRVASDAIDVLGGYGVMKEAKVERLMREAKIGQIVEGTNQIQRIVIARELLRYAGGPS